MDFNKKGDLRMVDLQTDITNTLNAKPTDDIPTLLRELEGLDTQAGEGDSKFFSQHHYIEQNDRSQNNEG